MRNQLLATAIVAAICGTVMGNDAVSGMEMSGNSAAYGSDEAHATAATSAATCVDCSDYDMGYRWASAQSVRSVEECASDNWSFSRGCRAFIRSEAAL